MAGNGYVNGFVNGDDGASTGHVPREPPFGRTNGRRFSSGRRATAASNSTSSGERPGPQRRSCSVSCASVNGDRAIHGPRPAGPRRALRSPSDRVRTSLAVGLALLMSAQVRQLSNVTFFAPAERGASSGDGAPRDWLMDLPHGLWEQRRRRRQFVSRGNDGPTSPDDDGLASTRARRRIPQNNHVLREWKRGQSLSDDRARRRRTRTRPPAMADPHDAPPRLTLDLPAHRSLMDQRPAQTNGIWSRMFGAFADIVATNGLRGRAQTDDGEPPQSSPSVCGPHAREAAGRHPDRYPASARAGPESRVVVTGALSQVGMELLLQLHERCRVGYIVGIDAAYPNTRHDRMEMIETRYKYVKRRVPGFQRLMVPVFGVHPHPKMGEGVGFDLVTRFNPTHIVHLAGMEDGRGEHVDYGDVAGVSPFSDEGTRGTMRRFGALLSMDQVLSSLARSNADGGGSGKAPPRLVYVTSDEAENRSGVLTGGAADRGPAFVYGTSCLLNEVLASYHRHRHGVDSVGLRVPSVFGPFSRPGSLLHDLAERTVRNAAGDGIEGVPKYHLDRDRYEVSSMWTRRDGAASGAMEQMAYVSDVAGAIVAAMQFKEDSNDPSIDGSMLFRIGSNINTSMRDMKEGMERYLPPADKRGAEPAPSGESDHSNSILIDPGLTAYDAERNRDLLGWTHETSLGEGMSNLLAWQIVKAYPFGLPVTVPSRSSFQNLLRSRGTLPLRVLPHRSLPCASGCQWGGGVCSTSAWDAVVDTTREVTKSCRFVLYTVDLRPELEKLKQSAPSKRSGLWEELFCKVAFVSSSSKLAGAIYHDELKNKDPMNAWNGKGTTGQWVIVALPGTQYTMPESERSLAKLTPTNLFNDGVEKALFVNHRRAMIATDQAMLVLQHMEMKERTTARKVRVGFDKKRKEEVVVTVPPRRRRRSVLFTNRFSFPDGFDASNAGLLAGFVMKNLGIAETDGIVAQRNFYEQTAHLTRTNTQRSDNYQDFFQDNSFEFDLLDSVWLAHGLGSEEGRILRCEVYEEHSLWGNDGMEDMSMGFVLSRRRVKMQLGKMAEPQYEKSSHEWYPLLVPRGASDDDAVAEGPAYLDYLESAQDVATDREGAEFHVTFLPQRRKK